MLVFHSRGLRSTPCLRRIGHGFVHRDRDPRTAKHVRSYRARSEDVRAVSRYGDDRRFKPDLAFASVYHHGDPPVHVLHDVFGTGRRGFSREICTRSGDRHAGAAYQLACDRIRRAAHRNGAEPARHLIRDHILLRKDHGERTRHELLRKLLVCFIRLGKKRCVRAVVYMYYKRIVARSALGGIYLARAFGKVRVRTEPVNGFGRERDKLAAPDQFTRTLKHIGIASASYFIKFGSHCSSPFSLSAASAVASASTISPMFPFRNDSRE